MSWAARFRLRQYLRQSVWFWPVVGAIAGSLLGVLDIVLESHVTTPPGVRRNYRYSWLRSHRVATAPQIGGR